MKLYNKIKQALDDAKNGVVILGNFDGLHLGHQAVVKKGVEIAKSNNCSVNVISFEPHPKIFFSKDKKKHFKIAKQEQKIDLMKKYGIDNLFLLEFSDEFSKLSPKEFVQLCLVRGLEAKHVVVGDNFSFGYMASGDTSSLEKYGKENGFLVDIVKKIPNISSSKCREFISNGDVKSFFYATGRFWEIRGFVEKGFMRGRELGFPTANIQIDDYILPKKGVYAVKVGIKDKNNNINYYNAVANFGKRPTFNLEKSILEVNIFDFNQDIYNEKIYVDFVDFIRSERKFSSIEELQKQIKKDKLKAKKILSKKER